MKITKISGTFHGEAVSVELTAPVAVIVGPTGVGKSSILTAAFWALTGELQVPGAKPVKKLGDVYERLAAGAGETIEVEVTVDAGDGRAFSVTRTIAPAKGDTLSQSLSTTLCVDGTIAAAQAAIARALGPVAVLDVGQWLTLGPSDRRERLLALCREHAPAWSEGQLAQALAHALVDTLKAAGDVPDAYRTALAEALKPLVVQPGQDFYTALAMRVEEAQQAVKEAQQAVKEAQQAVDELTRQAAESEETDAASVESLRSDLAGIQARIGGQREALGAAMSREQARSRDTDRLTFLRNTISMEQRQQKLAEAVAARDAAQRELDEIRQMQQEAAPTATSAELDAMRGELAELDAEMTGLAAEVATASARHSLLVEHLARLDGQPTCPLCGGHLVPEQIASLRAAMLAAEGQLTSLSAEAAQAAQERQGLAATVAAEEKRLHDAQEAWQARRRQREGRRAELTAMLAPMGWLANDIRSAESAVGLRREAEQEMAELEQRLAQATADDAGQIRSVLAELDAQRADLQARLTRAAAAAERTAAYQRAVARREEATARQPLARAVAKVWRLVLDEYGRAATAPFVVTVNALLPSGWRFEVDIDTMGFYLARNERRIPVAGLSRGEVALFGVAAMAAFAKIGGVSLRVVVADHAESLTSFAVDGADHGLLVACIQRLLDVLDAGAIDQAIVATSRLTPEEHALVGAEAGLVVIERGVDLRPAEAAAEVARADIDAAEERLPDGEAEGGWLSATAPFAEAVVPVVEAAQAPVVVRAEASSALDLWPAASAGDGFGLPDPDADTDPDDAPEAPAAPQAVPVAVVGQIRSLVNDLHGHTLHAVFGRLLPEHADLPLAEKRARAVSLLLAAGKTPADLRACVDDVLSTRRRKNGHEPAAEEPTT